MAQVNMPRPRRRDSLDTILKGLQIAGQVYGIKEAIEKSNLLSKQASQLDEIRQTELEEKKLGLQEKKAASEGIITPAAQSSLAAKGIKRVPEGSKGAQLFGVTPEGEKFFGVKPATVSPFAVTEEARKVRKEERDIAKSEREQEEKERKKKEDILARETPFGLARTKQDAKDIRDGLVEKKIFDNLVDEMIALREKYGGELLPSSETDRGKQLSKKALLSYKNMAKLGVLSQADEAIINAIIPKDPTEALTSLNPFSEDRVMRKLKGLKQDAEKDFQNQLKVKLEGAPEKQDAPQPPPNGALKIKDKQTGEVYTWDGFQYLKELPNGQ